ncbi:MAG: hypothetical protein VX438_00240 [Planctomycetota bacterium]|nr:hypothetical protein [Planctomycetota bacterium]
MHAGYFIELATDLSFHANQIVFFPTDEMVKSKDYCALAKSKLDHWNKTLAIFHEDLTDNTAAHDSWDAIKCLVEEILCTEFLVRVASAAFLLKDSRFRTEINTPVARAVFLFHLEARVKALELIEIGLKSHNENARSLNDLRHRLESWCDLLLGFFPPHIAREFSFDPSRNRAFNLDLSEETRQSRKNVERLLKISVREYMRKLVKHPAANPTLNRKFADLFATPDSAFDPGTTPFDSQAINDLTDEAERWIDDYLAVT